MYTLFVTGRVTADFDFCEWKIEGCRNIEYLMKVMGFAVWNWAWPKWRHINEYFGKYYISHVIYYQCLPCRWSWRSLIFRNLLNFELFDEGYAILVFRFWHDFWIPWHVLVLEIHVLKYVCLAVFKTKRSKSDSRVYSTPYSEPYSWYSAALNCTCYQWPTGAERATKRAALVLFRWIFGGQEFNLKENYRIMKCNIH